MSIKETIESDSGKEFLRKIEEKELTAREAFKKYSAEMGLQILQDLFEGNIISDSFFLANKTF